VHFGVILPKFAGGHQDDVVKHLKGIGVQVETLEQIVDSLLKTAQQRTYTEWSWL